MRTQRGQALHGRLVGVMAEEERKGSLSNDLMGLARPKLALTTVRRDFQPNAIIHKPLPPKPTAYYLLNTTNKSRCVYQ